MTAFRFHSSAASYGFMAGVAPTCGEGTGALMFTKGSHAQDDVEHRLGEVLSITTEEDHV